MAKPIRYAIGLMLLAAVSASAQVSARIKADVPFPYMAAEKNWAPGTYKLDINALTSSVTLYSPASGAMFLTHPGRQTHEGRCFLRFQRYGDRWVLEDITVDGVAHDVNLGKLERELIAQQNPSEEKVLIAELVRLE